MEFGKNPIACSASHWLTGKPKHSRLAKHAEKISA